MVNQSLSKERLQQARTWLRYSFAAHQRRWTWGILAPLALGILLLCAPVAQAAIQLNYFNVIPYPTSVTLEWSTASEVNVAGFDVQCKLASEPDSAFHEIGYVRAKGGPDVGALYTFDVTSGVVPGASYCFRLKEITTDGTPGEVLDRCGYGPMVTPTPGSGAIPVFTPIPVPTDAFGNPIVPTATPYLPPVPPAVATDAFGNPIPPTPYMPPAVPTDAFGSPLAVPAPVATDAFGNPIPGLVPQAVPTDAFGNPIPPTPTPYLPPPVATDAFGNPIPPTPYMPPAVPTDAFGSPLPTPIVPSSAEPPPIPTDEFGNAITPTAIPTAMPTDAQASVDAQLSAAAAVDPYATPLPGADGEAIVTGAQVEIPVATPTVAFVVVTATPTPAPVALAPVLTPLPTATPAPAGIQLASTLDPGQNLTQNLMIMLLCVTFTGAGGIGVLGLITTVMFMRSRSSQRDFFERTNLRRRY